jgi:hypothetical protein
MKKPLLLLAFLLPPAVMGGQDTYLCTVSQVLELSDQGSMKEHAGIYKPIIGKTFSINRDTGEMIGLPFDTRSYKEVTVLSRGNDQNSYKAIVISHPPNIWVKYIYVAEIQKGDRKPFWGTEDGNKVFSGICE